MKIEIPILITILGAAATFGGFYYSTSHRLDALESNVASLEKQISSLNTRVNKIKRIRNNKK